MLEVNRVPVKMLQRGAVFCEPCRVRRSRIKALRKEHPQRQGQSGVEELDRLEAEEADAQRGAGRKYEKASWPYG
jgi:hypothetical protein